MLAFDYALHLPLLGLPFVLLPLQLGLTLLVLLDQLGEAVHHPCVVELPGSRVRRPAPEPAGRAAAGLGERAFGRRGEVHRERGAQHRGHGQPRPDAHRAGPLATYSPGDLLNLFTRGGA